MQYQVTTRPGFRGPRRRRGSVEVARGATVIVELSAEELKAVKADPELVVREVKAEPKRAPAKSAKAKNAEPKQMVDVQDAKEA